MNNRIAKKPHRIPVCPACKITNENNFPFCRRCGFDRDFGSIGPGKSGRCIYCEKSCRLSSEHIFGKWIDRSFGSPFRSRVHTIYRPEEYSFSNTKYKSNTSESQGSPYLISVRNVCAQCNNGWMSNLQSEAKQTVKELASGNHLALNKDNIITIARWCMMISINMQCSARVLQATKLQRRDLMLGNMPTGWRISVSILDDPSNGGWNFNRSLLLPLELGNDDYVWMASACFVIERLAVHTVNTVGDGTLHQILSAITDINKNKFPTAEIWPKPKIDCFGLPKTIFPEFAKIQDMIAFR